MDTGRQNEVTKPLEEERRRLLNRLAGSVEALEEMLDQYTMYMRSGSFEAASEATVVFVELLRIAYETVIEIEEVNEESDSEMSLQEVGMISILGARLSATKARLFSLRASA